VRANRQINKPLKHQMFLLGTNMKQWPGTLAGFGRKWPQMARNGRTWPDFTRCGDVASEISS